MPDRWKHAELGAFEYDGLDWRRTLVVPAFRGFATSAKPKGACVVAFASDSGEPPVDAAVQLLARILEGQDELMPKLVESLWDDLNGRGPGRGGMWWHGNLAEVNEAIDDGRPIRDRADLCVALRPYLIRVEATARKGWPLLAEVRFRATFESEHGVGVLTDGRDVVGIGYAASCSPFRRGKPVRRRVE